MNIIEKPLAEIRPYEKNPRFNDGAVDAVANSIKSFGFKVPIVVDKDGVIVCGHTRYKAAQKLGLATVPCVVASDLTPKQIKAFRLVDNKTAELSVWDDIALDAELDELPDIDFTDFGFNYSGGDIATELESSLDDSDLPEVELTSLGRVIIRLPKEQAEAVNGWRKVNGDNEIVAFLLERAGIKSGDVAHADSV